MFYENIFALIITKQCIEYLGTFRLAANEIFILRIFAENNLYICRIK